MYLPKRRSSWDQKCWRNRRCKALVSKTLEPVSRIAEVCWNTCQFCKGVRLAAYRSCHIARAWVLVIRIRLPRRCWWGKFGIKAVRFDTMEKNEPNIAKPTWSGTSLVDLSGHQAFVICSGHQWPHASENISTVYMILIDIRWWYNGL